MVADWSRRARESAATKPVIVGIDGSRQSERAALWAVEEAVGRGVPLVLVYVIRTDLSGPLSGDEYRTALDDAKLALRAVCSELAVEPRPVAVETEIAQGFPAGVLLAKSTEASLICLGSSGVGKLGAAFLGSTAATVAERASCSVAIIGSAGDVQAPHGQTKWIMIPVSITDESRAIESAVDQARLLRRPLMAIGEANPTLGGTPTEALDSLVTEWKQRYPDVHIYAVSSDTTMGRFLRAHPEMAGLVVIDAASADDVSSIIGNPHGAEGNQPERAVLVAREHATRRSSPVPSALR